MFLCANCLSMCPVFFLVFLFFFFFFFFGGGGVCLDYSRTNEQILIKKIVDRT